MPVVVVESPAKAKTINKYLGDGYTVLASYGHVRDLPPKDGSVANMAIAYQNSVAVAQILVDRLGFGARFDNDNGHGHSFRLRSRLMAAQHVGWQGELSM